jgi:hypothetical protein
LQTLGLILLFVFTARNAYRYMSSRSTTKNRTTETRPQAKPAFRQQPVGDAASAVVVVVAAAAPAH